MTMLFDEVFFDGLPSDPREALERTCDHFFEFHRGLQTDGKRSEEIESYAEANAVLETMLEIGDFHYDIRPLNLGLVAGSDFSVVDHVLVNYNEVAHKLATEDAESTYERARESVRLSFGKSFAYQFSEGDLKRIQTLIAELREGITTSTVLSEDHRLRLLKRLEDLQVELHKRVGNLDRFWGVLIEAGAALGRFGREVKPLTDRIREIFQIVWTTQAGTLGLPSTTPFGILPSPQREKDSDASDDT